MGDSLLPERRLADPGFAIEDEHGEAGAGSVEEPLDHGELYSPADDLVRHPPPGRHIGEAP